MIPEAPAAASGIVEPRRPEVAAPPRTHGNALDLELAVRVLRRALAEAHTPDISRRNAHHGELHF